jgi:hypothetical protein
MSYVTEVTVKLSDSKDWHTVSPGNDWTPVSNNQNVVQDFNQGAGGKYVFIFYRAATAGDPISGLRMITGKDAQAPAGWQKINVDLNAGSGGAFIYLCYTTTPGAPQIDRLKSGNGGSVESAMNQFNGQDIVLRQDTNQGAEGAFVFLGYAYR